ncbi:MAG TPA: type II secretion system protein GspC [Nevskiaceae bacterium]|nr:type II secretion system protein GspC [Nevskiaceae bacterium]
MPRPLLALWERHRTQLPAALSLLLAVLLTQSLAGLLWKLVPSPEAARWQPAPVLAPSGPAPSAALPVREIASARLFGELVRASDTAALSPEQIRDTRLNLTLLGIFAATDGPRSRALIAQQNGEEKPYAVGDDVVSGVRLQQIFPDRVILSRNGQLETLRLDKDKPSRAPVGGFQNRPVEPEEEDEGIDDAADTAEVLADIRAEVLQDPSKASEYIRVQPANIGGQMKGYRIYPGRDRTIFSSAGLRPGDLVTQINGIQLDDPAKAMQMLGDLSSANNLTVVVERGGQQQTVNVNLN